MDTKLARIAEIVDEYPKRKLQTIVHCINAEMLKAKHLGMARKKAPGTDGITKDIYNENLDKNIEQLVENMKKQAYRPQPVRRVHIPKPGSIKLRPLGIPAYEDKLVQGVMADILNVIYEPEFQECSYGFRPGLSCHDAIKALGTIIERKKVGYVVDVDIRGFFDNVDHEWLMKFLEHRIEDKNFLRLIARFLKAGIMEEGKYLRSDVGTPQGGLISPILANIYLHYVLDLWFYKKIRNEMQGECDMVRYADDFACCFQYKHEAEKFYQLLKERLEKFNLEIAEEKTKIIEFGRFAEGNRNGRGEGKPETFTFLGFTHYCSKSKKGIFRVKRNTNKKKFQAKVQNMKKWLWENMHTPFDKLIKKLNIKLRGHYQYYGITDNYRSIRAFYRIVCEHVFKMLKRRTQKNNLTWEKYGKMIEYCPIITPKIYVSVYK